MDRRRNENIRRRWFEHVQRRENGCISRRMLKMELPDKRQRQKPKRTFMDVVRKHMQIAGLREDADGREGLRMMICF